MERLRNAKKNVVTIVPQEENRNYSLDPPQYRCSSQQFEWDLQCKDLFYLTDFEDQRSTQILQTPNCFVGVGCTWD